MSEFKADRSYSPEEQTLMEDITSKENEQIKTELSQEKLKTYVLSEIARANIDFLQWLDGTKKSAILSAINTMGEKAKTAFDAYAKRVGLGNYATWDEDTISTRDAGFWVAAAQALTINCCDEEKNLSAWVIERSKSDHAVDGRFGPNTLFAMNEVFKGDFKEQKFNGLLSDGDSTTTLLDMLIANVPTAEVKTEALTETEQKDLQTIIDAQTPGALKDQIKALVDANKTGIADYLNQETDATKKTYIQTEITSLLDDTMWTTSTAARVAFITELLASNFATGDLKTKLETIKTTLEADQAKQNETKAEKEQTDQSTEESEIVPAKDYAEFIANSDGSLTLSDKKATKEWDSFTKDAFGNTAQDMTEIKMGDLTFYRNGIGTKDADGAYPEYSLMTADGQGITFADPEDTNKQIEKAYYIHTGNNKDESYLAIQEKTWYASPVLWLDGKKVFFKGSDRFGEVSFVDNNNGTEDDTSDDFQEMVLNGSKYVQRDPILKDITETKFRPGDMTDKSGELDLTKWPVKLGNETKTLTVEEINAEIKKRDDQKTSYRFNEADQRAKLTQWLNIKDIDYENFNDTREENARNILINNIIAKLKNVDLGFWTNPDAFKKDLLAIKGSLGNFDDDDKLSNDENIALSKIDTIIAKYNKQKSIINGNLDNAIKKKEIVANHILTENKKRENMRALGKSEDEYTSVEIKKDSKNIIIIKDATGTSTEIQVQSDVTATDGIITTTDGLSLKIVDKHLEMRAPRFDSVSFLAYENTYEHSGADMFITSPISYPRIAYNTTTDKSSLIYDIDAAHTTTEQVVAKHKTRTLGDKFKINTDTGKIEDDGAGDIFNWICNSFNISSAEAIKLWAINMLKWPKATLNYIDKTYRPKVNETLQRKLDEWAITPESITKTFDQYKSELESMNKDRNNIKQAKVEGGKYVSGTPAGTDYETTLTPFQKFVYRQEIGRGLTGFRDWIGKKFESFKAPEKSPTTLTKADALKDPAKYHLIKDANGDVSPMIGYRRVDAKNVAECATRPWTETEKTTIKELPSLSKLPNDPWTDNKSYIVRKGKTIVRFYKDKAAVNYESNKVSRDEAKALLTGKTAPITKNETKSTNKDTTKTVAPVTKDSTSTNQNPPIDTNTYTVTVKDSNNTTSANTSTNTKVDDNGTGGSL
jgi:hypothetical protein